jgi:hypothetical protein
MSGSLGQSPHGYCEEGRGPEQSKRGLAVPLINLGDAFVYMFQPTREDALDGGNQREPFNRGNDLRGLSKQEQT